MICCLMIHNIPSRTHLKLTMKYNFSTVFSLQSPVQTPHIYALKHILFPSSIRRSWGLLLHLETRAETADGGCVSFAADSHVNSV